MGINRFWVEPDLRDGWIVKHEDPIEIHIGTRTVLEYLFSPIQKVAHEAGRER